MSKSVNLAKLNHDIIEKKTTKCPFEDVPDILKVNKSTIGKERFEIRKSLSVAIWDNHLKLAHVTKIQKNLTKNFSHSLNGKLYLYPEECLYLLEMRQLLLYYNGNQISIKHAYALMLAPENGCTFNEFKTYNYLTKLGFRVFRHDHTIKNENLGINCLTKLPELPIKKRLLNTINNLKTSDDVDEKGVLFPNADDANTCVMISKISPDYLPYNLQPSHDIYLFKMIVNSYMTKIVEILPSNEDINVKRKPFFEKEKIIFESKPTLMYPVYEKNILKKSKKYNKKKFYEPCAKRKKIVEQLNDSSLVVDSSDKSIINASKNEINDSFKNKFGKDVLNNDEFIEINTNCINNSDKMEIEENCLNNEKNKETEENNFNNKYNITNKEYGLNIEKNIETKKMYTYNVEKSGIKENDLNNEKKIKTEGNGLNDKIVLETKENRKNEENNATSLEDSTTNVTLMSRIKQKLFAIKTKKIQNEIAENVFSEHHINYDVYYANNHIAKSSRTVPDFRVIVFEAELNNFPNVYNVNISNPNDNVPTIWAVVNTNSLLFYNVNNIILPKAEEWNV